MKPCGNSLISAPERIREAQCRGRALEKKEGVYHKKAEEVYRESVASQLMDQVNRAGCGGCVLQAPFQGTTSAKSAQSN